MSLPDHVARYLVSWEGQSPSFGLNLSQLMHTIRHATLSQIQFEYNSLSQQSLWNQTLVNIFYNELLRIAHHEISFVITRDLTGGWMLLMGVSDMTGDLTSDTLSEDIKNEVISLVLRSSSPITLLLDNETIIGLSGYERIFFEEMPVALQEVPLQILEGSDFHKIRRMIQSLVQQTYAVVD